MKIFARLALLASIASMPMPFALASTGSPSESPEPAPVAAPRDPQAVTMHHIRSLGTGCEMFVADQRHYPVRTAWTSLTELATELAHYTEGFLEAVTDGWGQPIYYKSNAAGSEYEIRSRGADHAQDADPAAGEITDPRRDLVFQGGSQGGKFLSWPASFKF